MKLGLGSIEAVNPLEQTEKPPRLWLSVCFQTRTGESFLDLPVLMFPLAARHLTAPKGSVESDSMVCKENWKNFNALSTPTIQCRIQVSLLDGTKQILAGNKMQHTWVIGELGYWAQHGRGRVRCMAAKACTGETRELWRFLED